MKLDFGQSSYSELKIKKKKKFGTQVPCEVLEFLEKIQVELEYLSPKIFSKMLYM